MALGFRIRSNWKQSLGISALIHSLGLSSLFAMSVPIARTLVLQKGQIAVETIVIEASSSHPSNASTTIELQHTRIVSSQDTRQSIEGPALQARNSEDARALPSADPRLPALPAVLENPASIVEMTKVLPIRKTMSDEAIVELATAEKRHLSRPVFTTSSMNVASVPLLDFQRSGINEERLRIPLKGNEPPKYPIAELQKGIEGRVVLKLTVETDGTVSGVTIEKSSGREGLDRAAVEAVSKWLFEPVDIATGLSPETLYAPITFKIAN